MKRVILILSLFLGLAIQLPAHPVHISVCNLEFDQEGLTIAVKLFQDDLLLAIQTEKRKEIDLADIEEEKNLQIMADYVEDNIHIGLNKNENLKLNYYQYEINEEAIWFYFNIKGLKTGKKLYITNTLMVELYHDQTNLVILNFLGNQNGYRFNYYTREQDIDLK